VLELAYAAGFNSKASFYRLFRRSHGTTPTAFLREITP
jgi:AraC-like DNA-binding protein